MSNSEARPHWISALVWVLACFLTAGALSIFARWVNTIGHAEPSDAQALGEVAMLRHPAGAPRLTPAQAEAASNWQPVAMPVSTGWTSDTVWLRMAVRNTGVAARSYWLEVVPSWLSDVRVHSLQSNGSWQTQVSGNGMHGRNRPLDLAELVFPLTLAAGEQRAVLLETSQRVFALNLSVALHAASNYPGRAERANLVDLLAIGGVLALGAVSLALGLALRHLGFFLLAARAFAGVLFQLQQFGAGALLLSAPLAAALSSHTAALASVTQILSVAFIWSFMWHAEVARWVHWVFGLLLSASLVLAAAPTSQPVILVMIPFFAFTIGLSIHLVFRGYLPAVALLAGALTAVLVNMHSLAGQAFGAASRFTVAPLPMLITLPLLLLAAGLALRRERSETSAALRNAQSLAVQNLAAQVAARTRELQAARDEADRANRAKSEFLAKVSHELRTPLHSVLGYLDLTLREKLLPAVARRLAVARTAGQQLVSQVNDLLDFARMERSLIRLECGSTGVQQWLKQIKDLADQLAEERGCRFTLDADPSLPAWLWIDANRLAQVLTALLSNAFKYAPGDVVLHVGRNDRQREEGADGQTVSLRFDLVDHGRGISAQALSRIFHAFERGDAVDGDGLGLGLPITQHLLGLMGSQLEVSSVVGEGSRFGFTLTVPVADESDALIHARPPDIAGYSGRTRDVLILDDNAINRTYLEELLGDLGFTVHMSATVADAIGYLESLPQDQSGPDLCIVDQHLGGGDTGWDFVSALRTSDRVSAEARNAAVLMMSATEPRRPAGWSLKRDVDRHVLKPADQQLLLQTVGELLLLTWNTQDRSSHGLSGSPLTPGAAVDRRM